MYEESLDRLRKEEEQCKQNKKQKQTSNQKKKMGNNSRDIDVDENVCYIRNEDPPSNNKESEDADEVVDLTQCDKCNRWYHLKCVDDHYNLCQFCN